MDAEEAKNEQSLRPKQVIIMRTDLGMRKGKMMAQAAHASMYFLQAALELRHYPARHDNDFPEEEDTYMSDEFELSEEEYEWLKGSHAKICVGVGSEEEMLAILAKALEKELTAHLVIDSGFTEFKGVPTKTCIAIGPHYPDKFSGLTDHLKLL